MGAIARSVHVELGNKGIGNLSIANLASTSDKLLSGSTRRSQVEGGNLRGDSGSPLGTPLGDGTSAPGLAASCA